MPILGLDASTRAGSVAVVDGGRVLGAVEAAGGMDHSVRLLPGVALLLRQLGLRLADLRGIAVTVGPGSFTGIRVGLATARGLARSAGLPATGITSLEALGALNPGPRGGLLCPWIDAGRGEVYAAAYPAGDPAAPPWLPPAASRPEVWLARLPVGEAWFLGDGALRHHGLLVDRFGPGCILGEGPWFLARTAAALGESALAGARRRLPLEPLYLRPSDAERTAPPVP